MIAVISPSTAFSRSAFAAARCVSSRSTKKETRTFASITTLRTSDTSSALPRFRNRLYGVGGTVLEDSFPPEQARPFRGDRDFAAADLPGQPIAGADVERIADFFRNGRLAFAGDGGGRHIESLQLIYYGKDVPDERSMWELICQILDLLLSLSRKTRKSGKVKAK